MRYYSLYIILCCFLVFSVNAQEEKVLLTKNFKFNDGLFMNFEEFKSNQPSYSWEDLDFDLFANPQTFITKVSFIKTLDGKEIDLNTVWGLSIDGIPHVRLEKGTLSDELFVFVSMKVRGKICYYSYTEESSEQVTIKAYNPLNRQPFRSGVVEREVTKVQERMIDFDNGQVDVFTVDTFLKWIADVDPELSLTIQNLSQKEAKEKLFKCLLIYVDRHAVYTNK